MKACLLIVLTKLTTISGLLCIDILQAPESNKWSLSELQTIPPKEIVTCLAHLGKEKISTVEAEYVWNTIVKFYDGVPNIPESVLMQLHWISTAVKPEDYYNITLNNIDVIENFGLDYNLTPQQLSAIADRVREDFGSKEPEDYTYYDLIAMRQILCAFNKSEIERIRPQAYKEAAAVLGKLNNCNSEVLEGLAILAVQKNAFGSPSNWDEAIKEAIGTVAEHVRGGMKKVNTKLNHTEIRSETELSRSTEIRNQN